MISIVPFTADLAPAVRAFNLRIAPAGVTRFPESPVSEFLPAEAGRRTYEESFLAMEGGRMRGGYILVRQEVSFGGEIARVAGLRLPISEALVDGQYGMVPSLLLRNALKREPLLWGAGMGGEQRPVARLLRSGRFCLEPVPFYFKITRPARFLTQSKVVHPWAAGLAAWSGAAWAASRAADLALVRERSRMRGVRVEAVNEFGGWADGLWDEVRHRYACARVRDSHMLNAVYRPDGPYERIQVWDGARLTGWAVLLDLQLREHPKFGNARSGQIVDCFGQPEDAPMIMKAACRFLTERGVDFIRSHQSHPAWGEALGGAGFLRGRSYFIFTASAAFRNRLNQVDPHRLGLHVNRGDGDSPFFLPKQGEPVMEHLLSPARLRLVGARKMAPRGTLV
jgi:hypothetical protein